MRRGWALLLALLLAPLNGCFTVQPEQPGVHHNARVPFATPASDELVVMEIALLEGTVNDAYLNGSLWDVVDETANAERQTLLHDNGFRMGSLGPTPPEDLISLMMTQRNQTNIRQRLLPAGMAAAVPIGPSWTQCSFDLKKNGDVFPVELDKAQFGLDIVASAGRDGGTTLTFTPLVRHGEPNWLPRPTHDPNGVMRWEKQAQEQPSERYPWLSWELNVATNEYVVVGTQSERIGTLGHRTFLNAECAAPAQRLLVMRVVRPPRGESKTDDLASQLPLLPESFFVPFCGETSLEALNRQPPPLAAQAAWSAVRGVRPEK